MELHGGEIHAHSAGKGTGTTFRAWLPRSFEEAAVAPAPERARSFQVRVLLVEDNRDLMDMLTRLLRKRGHRVWSFPSGEAAMGAMDEAAPDVVLVDIGLPGMDGYEVARRMRRRHPDVHLVALTGYGQMGDRARAAEAGFDDHLVKPVEAPEALMRAWGGGARSRSPG